MATLVGNSTSLSRSSSDLVRKEINAYVAKLNFILIFPQLFVALTGLFGNILALIVINKKSLRKTSSAVFITYMAIFDSAVLILQCANLARPRNNLFIHCSLTYLTDLSTFCANWILVIITLERCVAVSSPFLAKRFCTVHSARYSVYILLGVAFLIFTSTFPIIYHSNGKKCLIRPDYGLIHRIYQPIFMYGIPDILLLSNLFTVYILIHRQSQYKKRLPDNDDIKMRISDVHSSRKQRQLTIMLVTVNLSFYLFTTPAMIIYIAEYFPRKHSDIRELKRSFVFSQVSVLLLQLNNATNFIFYCLAGQRFRQATRHTFHQYLNRFEFVYHRRDKNHRLSINYQSGRTRRGTGSGIITTSTTCSNRERLR